MKQKLKPETWVGIFLIAGILMAIVQFVPEMQRKCLKLTLHLPYPELKMTGNMLSLIHI